MMARGCRQIRNARWTKDKRRICTGDRARFCRGRGAGPSARAAHTVGSRRHRQHQSRHRAAHAGDPGGAELLRGRRPLFFIKAARAADSGCPISTRCPIGAMRNGRWKIFATRSANPARWRCSTIPKSSMRYVCRRGGFCRPISASAAGCPAHLVSLGRVMLASLPRDKRDAYLASVELTPVTVRTVTDAQALNKQLDLVEAQGHALG